MSAFRRDDVPFYLVFAAAVTTVVSITAFEILMALALAALLAARTSWRLPPLWIPLAIFTAGTLASLAASGHARDGLPQIRKLYVYLMLFLVATAFQTVRQVREMVVWCSLAASLSALWGLVQFVQKYERALSARRSFYEFYMDARITGFTSHWMTLGGQMMLVLLLIAALVFLAAGRRRNLWLIAAAVPVAAALEETWTRSMWLGALCGGLYLIWFWNRRALVAVPVLIAAVLVLNPFAVRERAVSALAPRSDLDSNAHRAELRRIGWEMIKAHPWLGIGPEQVSRQAGNYLPPGLPRLTPGQYYGHLENDYLQYAAERGVPTMLALMGMISWALVDFARALRRLPPGAEERWVLHAAIAVTIGILVGGLFSWNLNTSEVLAPFLAVLGCGYVAVWQAEDRSRPLTCASRAA